MGLFENIDKLINERGSANILRERLLLADDKYSALEKKNTEFQSENVILKSKIQKLESENQRFKFDNEQLKTQIQNLPKSPVSHSNLLNENESNILLLLSKYEELIDEQIARSLNLNLQVVKYHLQELDDKKMIGCSLTINSPTQWYLNHEGRKYLIDNKLIS
ncbi:MAG: hypothetical protein WA104_08570 [Thermodesulfovibrionales bacterium]